MSGVKVSDSVRNPWLDIPAADYIGHMSSPEVAQHQILNRLLREILRSTRPCNVLVLGCSTGNGLEHVDPAVTSRVVGIDINPVYLQRLVEQFPHPALALDVRCTDLAAHAFESDVFDLVHAALVFELLRHDRVRTQRGLSYSRPRQDKVVRSMTAT